MLIKTGVWALIAVLLAGCHTKQWSVQMRTQGMINGDSRGQAAPMLVKLYQLSDSTRLLGAMFRELWQDDQNALGRSLLRVQEIMVYPAQTIQKLVPIEHDVVCLCIVGFYRKPWNKHWRD